MPRIGSPYSREPATPSPSSTSQGKISKSPKKWGLALGGGGARGIAHVGIIKTLERAGLIPDVITGTSIGALVGGLYACRPDAGALERRFFKVLAPDSEENKPLKLIARLNWDSEEETSLFNRLVRSVQKELFLGLAAFRNGVLATEDLRSSVAAFLPDQDIAETRIPFMPLTVDMISGRAKIMKKGSIIEAVMASCAVPGFMPPVRIGDAMLMDGGIVDPIPVDAAKDWGADVVVAVDVGTRLEEPYLISDGIDAINRATQIMGHYLGNPGRESCDLLIKPVNAHVEWTNFTGYDELIHMGESAASRVLADLRKIVKPEAIKVNGKDPDAAGPAVGVPSIQ